MITEVLCGYEVQMNM